MDMNNMELNASLILTSTITELVNKGHLAEMTAGLEILRYQNPNLKYELHYWMRQAKNATAELIRSKPPPADQ